MLGPVAASHVRESEVSARVTLFAPPGRAHRPARRRPGRPALRPARRTRSPPRWSSCRRKGIERWLSQRLSHRLGAGPPAGRGLRRGASSARPRSLVVAAARHHERDDPWDPDRAGRGRCSTVLDACARRAVGRPAGRPPRPRVVRARRPTCAAIAATRWPAGSPACSRRTPRSGRRSGRLARGRDDRRPGRPLRRRPGAGSPRSGAPWSTRSAPRRPTSGTPTRSGGCAVDGRRPARPALALRPHPAPGHRGRAARRARHPPRRPPVAAPPRSTRSGRRWPTAPGPGPRRDHPGHLRVGHPLLATLGRDVRELQARLARVDTVDDTRPAQDRPDTLLGWLQSDLSANTVAPDRRARVAADDRSVQVHRCHGPARQVDVLREVLVGLLQDDPTLQPRDILVMCPDIETYAPLITAGLRARRGGPRRPTPATSCACCSPTGRSAGPTRSSASPPSWSTSPAAGSPRASCSTWPRCRWSAAGSASATTTSTRWPPGCGEAGIRWGLDQEHREPYGLAGIVHNTWQFGLDRILTGVTMSEDARAWLDVTLPARRRRQQPRRPRRPGRRAGRPGRARSPTGSPGPDRSAPGSRRSPPASPR